MILAKDLNKLFNSLLFEGVVQIPVGGSEINVLLEDKQKISLKSIVYQGDNFIPISVRKCAAGKQPFSGQWINTQLHIDEDRYTIFLTYHGTLESLNRENLRDLLDEFGWQTDEWRFYLEEHDRKDLVHIYAKPKQ